ncbi:hypothetical protein [Flavobacterium sp.]|uniref:hypothetical protein n=1 Tax=Flavobacterium sp. TaxID=239 RepID=UPI003751E641
MKNILYLFIAFATFKSFAQDTIQSHQAKNHIGELFCVTGKVASIKLASDGKTTNYINIDRPYPEAVFTIVITNEYLETLKFKLEDIKDKIIFVYGKITIYKNDPKQIPQIFNPRWIDLKK